MNERKRSVVLARARVSRVNGGSFRRSRNRTASVLEHEHTTARSRAPSLRFLLNHRCRLFLLGISIVTRSSVGRNRQMGFKDFALPGNVDSRGRR